MSSLVHVVVEHLGLAQDGRLAEDAGVEVPDGDLVAVGGATAVTRRDAVRLDLRPVEKKSSLVNLGQLREINLGETPPKTVQLVF